MKKKYEFASTTEIDYYKLWVDEIVSVMCQVTGEPEPIFLSDLSMIGDLPPEEKELKEMAEILGIKIAPSDFVVDLAKCLKKSRE